MEAYGTFAKVYDELMDNIPYEKWGDRLDRSIRRYGISKPDRGAKDPLEAERNLVLDLGCGTGTLTEFLYRRGYDMIGVDLSEDMLGQALKKREKSGSEILYLQQDMRQLELYGAVGTVFCVCDVLNYILEEKELLQVFSLVRRYLFPGGIFLLDFNTVYKYRETLGNVTIAENRADCSFIWENYYDPEEEINEYELTLFLREEDGRFRRQQESHFQRGYTIEQIASLLEKAGMAVAEATDADTGEAVKDTSQRIYLVAVRQEEAKGRQK